MSGSTTVLSDAQMGVFQVIKPPPGFEQLYHGQDATVPIAFPGTLDPLAGREGFSPNLLAGVPVPLGGRVLVLIPMAIHAAASPSADYLYQFAWRIRNQTDVNEAISEGRQPTAFHLPSEQLGRRPSEIVDPSGQPLFYIPGVSDVEAFEQAEPGSGPAQLNVLQQRYLPSVDAPWVQPLTPTGASGVWQQGAYNLTQNTNPSGPTYVPLWMDAAGDELLVLAYKADAETPWDFNVEGADAAFSDTYGNGSGQLPNNPNIGILISTGAQGS